MIGYLFRFNDTITNNLILEEKKIDFSTPIVGVHIRRTDKIGTPGGGTMSKEFQVEVYMQEVEGWFKQYEMSHNKTKRQIYLATDEPEVLNEVHAKYPDYTTYDSIKITESAATTARSSAESVLGVIHDVHLLACTHFVVCTHTSNICGLVYELLHYKHGEASHMLHSLDRPYSTYPYVYNTPYEAMLADNNTNLKRGDLLETYNIDKSYFSQSGNSYLLNTYNKRTKEKHPFQKYKLKQLPRLFNFSNFY